jgi:pyruvate/2-oxoglutarate dehydrogenase complex dihydrolipoamide acyltransferase (E2) component
MSVEVLMPKLGFSMNEGAIAEWLVADGCAIKEGQAIYVVESEKSTQEIEAPASGVIKIIGQTGATYPVGTVVAVVS